MSLEIAEGTATQASPGAEPHVLRRRLGPLYLATFLQNLALWVPIEKLFMTTIGFTSGSIGVMASVYAIVVPVLEVPSGVVADRWSRRGVLILGSLAATVSVVIGGFSQSVGAYLISAAFLGVFFALQSGTLESIVYDTLLEETGDSGAFERTIGRVRLVESVALVTSALACGAIAEITPLRTTYFLTAPLLLASIVLLFSFREPQLHKGEERESFRRQIAATYRTILGRGPLRAVVALTVAGALIMQGMLEFGPLWLVALVVPAFLYGPHWAGLTSALGVGGVLGGQSWLTRRWVVPLIGTAIVACSVVLAVSRLAGLVIAAQVAITLLVVAVSIPVTPSRRRPVGDPRGRRRGRRSADDACAQRGSLTYRGDAGRRRPGAGERADVRARSILSARRLDVAGPLGEAACRVGRRRRSGGRDAGASAYGDRRHARRAAAGRGPSRRRRTVV